MDVQIITQSPAVSTSITPSLPNSTCCTCSALATAMIVQRL
jgi:hypothetical protein